MTIRRIKDTNGFHSIFNDENGDYARTGILDKDGNDTGIDPLNADFPQLLDIGIMGHCTHGLSGKCKASGIECYQNGSSINAPNMKLDNFMKIIKEIEGKTFQVALGGRGDAELHENFEDILYLSREHGVVPNTTTSGYELNKNHVRIMKRYCGAVAVSYYKNLYTDNAVKLLLEEGVTTNMHFVLGKNNIHEAIQILKENKIPKGVSRFVFLLHKPVGMGSVDRILSDADLRVKEFFSLLSNKDISEKVGFDSCLVPGIAKYCKDIMPESYDACEAGRFSAYIDADMNMSPCSFDKTFKTSESLLEKTIEEVWKGERFSSFRNRFVNSCSKCIHSINCLGGCPINTNINLCGNKVVLK